MTARLLLPMILIGTAAPLAADALLFEPTRVIVRATPADEVVKVEFPFTNQSDAPATVTSIRSDCHCLVANAPDGPIAAGAKGAISADFKISTLSGLVEKYLFVTYQSGGKETRVALTAAVSIPKVLELDPPTLRWNLNNPMEEQSAEFRVLINEPVRLTEVLSSRPEFDLRIEEVEEGRRYRVHVKPKAGIDRPLLSILHLQTDCRYPAYQRLMGFLSIEQKPSE